MKRNTKTTLLILAAVIALLAGAVALIYPEFSAWYTERTRAKVATSYYEQVEREDNAALRAAIDAAHDYNERLYTGEFSLFEAAENGYYEQLDLIGNGIMGYIEIPKINVYLPVYHGVGDAEMHVGAGHMSQSSLPVGGENTHAVISAHTGQASEPLFSNLPVMDEGDLFYVHVYDMTLAYKICEIEVVKPWQIDTIKIEQGRDLVSLVTCYPFPTNTERLVVRGERVEYTQAPEETVEATEPVTSTQNLWLANRLYGMLFGAGAFVVLLILLAVWKWISTRRKRGGQ